MKIISMIANVGAVALALACVAMQAYLLVR